MTSDRKEKITALLKAIETGDEASVLVVNADKYVQHNPQTEEGGEGLAELFKRLSKTSPSVNVVRIFSDGDYVFGHTEYEFSSSSVGFEVFRFEGDHAVEHWDNIQSLMGPNLSGHSMVSGETQVSDLNKTEENRQLVKTFISEILISGIFDQLDKFIDANTYIEHNPRLADGLLSLHSALSAQPHDKITSIQYDKLHRLLVEGNFSLTVCEGLRDGILTSFYDLWRVADGKIVEHWDTTETVPPHSEWKNENGKF